MSEQQPSRPVVLNVNDHEAARYVVTTMLTRTGFTVVEASTGREALDAIESAMPDIVVLDVKLPDISGLEVCRRIRARSDGAAVKILHTSATFVSVGTKVQSLELGADAYLTQPFEQQELIATVRSLLRLKRAEQELRDRAEELRAADRRKDELLAMLAHELRNPLAAIAASLPMLERRVPADNLEANARSVVRRQTAHLGRLVEDLLEMARVMHDKIELRTGPMDLTALINRVVANLRRTTIDRRGQSVQLTVPSGPVIVNGDELRLEQIFCNLLDNASKYSDPGGPIEVKLERVVGPAGPAARVVVRDHGLGIAEDLLPEIFELFAQGEVNIARSRGGLGLGLTLVRKLVELHGGEVRARSEGRGRGSAFEVELPIDAAAQSSLQGELDDLQQARNVHIAEQASSLARAGQPSVRRILIVEDNLDAQQALADLCRLWGYEVECASDGVTGLTRLAAEPPDVAIVDIGLPGLDGYELARRARREAMIVDTVLVALTGYGSPQQRAEALQAGFDLHLVKPVMPEHIASLLDGMVNQLRGKSRAS